MRQAMFLEVSKKLDGPVLTKRASLLVGEGTSKQMHICSGAMSRGVSATKKNTAGMGGECVSSEDRKTAPRSWHWSRPLSRVNKAVPMSQ